MCWDTWLVPGKYAYINSINMIRSMQTIYSILSDDLGVFRLPAGVKKVLHPVISCALSADLAAAAYGYLSGSGFDAVLGS
jgi:hypothetical protein